MQNYDDQSIPYRKKASKKNPKKSDHKHDFQPCVFEYYCQHLNRERGFIKEKEACCGTYCVICGKIGSRENQYERIQDPLRPHVYSYQKTDECKRQIDPATRTLPTFWLDDYFKTKFVFDRK